MMSFAAFIHAPEFEGKEKHVSDISLAQSNEGAIITVNVGKDVLHPTTRDHCIEWAQLFGKTQDGKFVQVGTLDFGKGTALPIGTLTITREDYMSLTAPAYCNFHGIGDNSIML
jgi:desulfoferrodoxin-like iron-binding protein